MREGFSPGMAVEQNIEAILPVPEIYKRIDQKAPAQSIVEQIFADFYGQSSNREKVYLGIEELLKRGLEGQAALRWMASESGELGEMSKKVLAEPDMSAESLEHCVGIPSRFKNVAKLEWSEQFLQRAFSYAQDHGYLNDHPDITTFESFLRAHLKQVEYWDDDSSDRVPTHLAGKVEQELIAQSATFGIHEPEYLELNGPREILRVRSKEQPQLLLLGSMGPYSAREFANFGKKIHASAVPSVVDIDTRTTNLAPYAGENGLQIIRGDAAQLPLKEQSVEQVYTNHLFHALIDVGFHHDPSRERILRVIEEAARVLAPNGSFLVCEQPYGNKKPGSDESEQDMVPAMVEEITALAARAGLRLTQELKNAPSFFMRKDVNGSTIDECGFPQYGDRLLVQSIHPYALLRFVKE